MVNNYLIKVIRNLNSLKEELNNITNIDLSKLSDYDILNLKNPAEILIEIEETSQELKRIEPNIKIIKLTQLFIYFLDNEDYENCQKINNIIECKQLQQNMKEDLF